MEKEKNMLHLARELRKNMTPQESTLWYTFLRHYPVKWYKQKIIEPYIVDFYCEKAKLVVEIDGSQHYEPKNTEYDENRTAMLKKQGLYVLRFSNHDVNTQLKIVCEHIHNTVTARLGYDPYSK